MNSDRPRPPSLATIKRNRKKWVKALRSGKWKQTREAMHEPSWATKTTGTHCCLGVARRVCHMPVRFEEDGQLSEAGCAVLGLSYSQMAKLIDMNDNDNKDFKTIADHIEKLPLSKVKK